MASRTACVAAVAAMAVVGCGFCVGRAGAEVVSGEVDGKGLLFLGKFCYEYDPAGNEAGQAVAKITTDDYNVNFLLFDDQKASWEDVYDNDKCDCNCMQTAAISSQMVNPNVPGGDVITSQVFEKLRPRFWYAALLNCEAEVSAKYTLTMTQASGSQFGVNEQGMFALYLVMFFVWMIGFGLQIYASRWLWKARTYHPIVKLFTLSIAMWWLFCTCSMIHWAVFGGDGIGAPFLEGLARIFEVVGRVTFLLLMMLLAKGWTISSTLLTERAQLLATIGVLMLLYLILAIWDLAGRNPASTVYAYDAPPGILVVLVHCGVLVWFAKRCMQSYREEAHTEKRKFFKLFGLVYSIWFISLPFIVIVGSAVSPWVRQKTVETMIMLANTLWYAILGYLLWPSRATEYFEIQTDEFAIATSQQYEDL